MITFNEQTNWGFSFQRASSSVGAGHASRALNFQANRLRFGRYFRTLTRTLFGIAIATAMVGTSKAVTVNWGRSGSANVTGYRIYYGAASGAYTNAVTTGNTAAGIVNGLNPGTYYFTVAAFDANGIESVISNEMSYTVPAARGTGGPVLRLVVSPAKRVTITGQALPGASYDVQYSTNYSKWNTLTTITADASGNVQYIDPLTATRPMCVYRLLGR